MKMKVQIPKGVFRMKSRRNFIKTAGVAGLAIAATGYSATAKAGSAPGDDPGKATGPYSRSIT